MTEFSEDPKNWESKKKLLVLIIISFTISTSPVSISIYYPALIAIREYFNTTQFIVNISVGLFILFTGLIPLVVGSYADVYGRRKVYIFVMFIFTLSSILCAMAENIWVLIAMRTLQSLGSSGVQCICGGIANDVFTPTERKDAYSKLFLGSHFGELIGSIIGGLLTEYLGWHSIFWFLSIYGSILLFLIIYFIPETLYIPSPEVSSTTTIIIKQFNPLLPFKLLYYPNITLTILYNTSIWIIIYVLDIIIPFSFTNIYNLSSLYIGLVFLARNIVCIVGNIFAGIYSEYLIYKYERKKGNEESYPELKLKSIWIGVILAIPSFFIFGWILEKRVYIIWPLIIIFIGEFGILFLVSSTIIYLTEDPYPEELHTLILVMGDAINALISTIAIISTVPIENKFGIGWLFTALTSLALLSNILIILVYFKGEKWRI
ncbi:major facilitator superfamily domain-containing protein [Glomus cerebriforme]|uniref:Major facilitator superfamily domain-containing protein n=1 Tax=Glomus cerebriforme TaxID=658196 RepID=A0A397SGQ0_9GLOM|nr:major facilitator superfamily domain-containing protein [Glomus cerebriforme]